MIKFILVGHPRTGSTLFRELMNQNPQVQMYSELFHPNELERKTTHAIPTDQGTIYYNNPKEDAFDFLKREVWNYKNSERYDAVGFKLFSERVQTEGTERFFARIKDEFGDVKIIHLVRDNLLDVWVSRKLAEKSGVWRLQIDAQRDAYDKVDRIDIDPEELGKFFENTSMMTDFFRRHFSGTGYIEVNYDKLVATPQNEIDRMHRFLDVLPHSVQIHLQKQNKRPLIETVTNYHEIAARFEQSPYSSFFSRKLFEPHVKNVIDKTALSIKPTVSSKTQNGLISSLKKLFASPRDSRKK